jgi:hypothetical protein
MERIEMRLRFARTRIAFRIRCRLTLMLGSLAQKCDPLSPVAFMLDEDAFSWEDDDDENWYDDDGRWFRWFCLWTDGKAGAYDENRDYHDDDDGSFGWRDNDDDWFVPGDPNFGYPQEEGGYDWYLGEDN